MLFENLYKEIDFIIYVALNAVDLFSYFNVIIGLTNEMFVHFDKTDLFKKCRMPNACINASIHHTSMHHASFINALKVTVVTLLRC